MSTSDRTPASAVVINTSDRCTRQSTDVSVRLAVREVVVHPEFRKSTSNKLIDEVLLSDLALIRVDRPMDPLPSARPVCLPFEGTWEDQLERRRGEISGWGQVREGERRR